MLIPGEDVTGEHDEILPSDRDASSPSASVVDTLHVRASLQQANDKITTLKAEISSLKMKLCHSKAQIKEVWCNSCECLAWQDNEISLRDTEIAQLRQRLQPATDLADNHDDSFFSTPSAAEPRRRTGRAPIVDPFNGEKPDVLLGDWLIAFIRASSHMEWVDKGRTLATVCRAPSR